MTCDSDTHAKLRERVRDFIYDCTSDEFNTGWAPSAQQADDLIEMVASADTRRMVETTKIGSMRSTGGAVASAQAGDRRPKDTP